MHRKIITILVSSGYSCTWPRKSWKNSNGEIFQSSCLYSFFLLLCLGSYRVQCQRIKQNYRDQQNANRDLKLFPWFECKHGSSRISSATRNVPLIVFIFLLCWVSMNHPQQRNTKMF